MLAFHLTETIAALFLHVLHHPSKVLYDPETEPLFLQLFWCKWAREKAWENQTEGLLASFEEWFGSINMMNILYVWFPASWGPSVVEAIQTRNVTCLGKKPIVRDPTERKLPGARGPEKSPVGSKSGTSRQRVSILSWWVGGWGPRYLARKRERGPVRVPSSLTED